MKTLSPVAGMLIPFGIFALLVAIPLAYLIYTDTGKTPEEEAREEFKIMKQMYEQEKKNCDDYMRREALKKDPVKSLRWRLISNCPAECTCVEDAQKELDRCTLLRGMCEDRLFEATKELKK